ncbi:hypothetical protein SAG0137_07530 [Streptococcus agalactiae LMG 14838]|nr:hypothetical protein SAG0137_07530 [Streptococcus agalactiae LMG 14838]
MKIKKIISGLAAALIISSLSTINYEVKADDTTSEYHYISKQNNEEQLISYIKENIVCSINLLLIMSTHSLN